MLIAPLLATALAADLTLAPGEDWCAALNAAAPGDTITLAAGEHAGPCTITASGEEGAPITLAGEDAAIVYEGASANVTDLNGSHLVLRGLRFGPTSADIDAVKIRAGEDITLSENRFDRVGGISVSANSADTARVSILNNEFEDLRATGLYLGCHDGTCISADFLIQGNRFDGVTSTGVGYAMETKLGSYGTIADNTVHDAQGPAVEVYGSSGGERTVVERNLVIGSRDAATLEIGGGPALVRNNIVIGGAGAALSVYDYGGRGLVQDIVVIGNTLWGVGGAAVNLSGWEAGAGLAFEGNALGRDDGASAMPEGIDGVPMEGNLDCLDGAACWRDATGWDLWPLEAGALVGAGVVTDPALTEDWCGRSRAAPPTVGALEPGSGEEAPFSIDATAAAWCPELPAEDTGDTGDTGDTAEPADTDASGETGRPQETGAPKDAGCGCASGGGAAGGLSLLLALGLLRRRSAR